MDELTFSVDFEKLSNISCILQIRSLLFDQDQV